MQVKEIMSRDVVTISPDAFPQEAFELLKENQFHHLAVTSEEGNVIGMLSRWDFRPIVNALASSGNLKGTSYEGIQLYNVGKVKDLMTPDPISICSDDEIGYAARLMLDHGFHSLPVIDQSKLVGILTHRDLLRVVADQSPN